MTETPQERIDRLQRELAAAKVEQMQQQLAQAQRESGQPAPAGGYQLPRLGPDPSALPPPMPGWQPGASAPPGVDPGLNPGLGQFGSVEAMFEALGANVSPARAAMVNSAFGRVQQWAEQNGFGGVMVAGHGPEPDAPGMDLPLSPPPRRVPLSFRAAMLPWKWWDLFTLFMVAVAPIAAWLVMPASAAAVGIVTFVVLCYFRMRGVRMRIGILKWGVVAEVRSAGPVSVGTYYSGTTYQNVRLAVAHGWQVDRGWYSGPGYKTRIVYGVGGVQNELILHGRKYWDGVILADSRRPEIALCVSQFPYDLVRDQEGNWVPHVGLGLWLGTILQAGLYLGWLAFSIYLATVFWPPLL